MKKNFKRSLDQVLVHEGGWADHPRDPGGATMKGVTLRTFRRHFGSQQSKQSLRNISDEQLETVYRAGYWDKSLCDKLPGGIDYAVFDGAVNSGPNRSAKWLQAAVGAKQDGSIGPITLAQIKKQDPVDVINSIADRRINFLQSLATWPTFGKGWGRRVAEVRVRAIDMAAVKPPPVTPTVKFNTTRRGSRGIWVRKLQAALQLHVDGRFGKDTEIVLKNWQRQQGLEIDGIAGRYTYRALGLIA